MTSLADSAQRLRSLRRTVDLSQAEFAKKIGISQRKMSRIETTQDLDRSTARLIAHLFSVSEKWLMSGEGEEPNWEKLANAAVRETLQNLASSPDYRSDGRPITSVPVPIFDAVPNMGGGNIVEQDGFITGQLPIPYNIYQSGFRRFDQTKLAAFCAEGDSMSPTISSGDYVVVTMDQQFRGDGIYLVQLYESLLIKRLQRQLDNTILLISDNQQYREQTVTEADENAFKVLGRLLWVSHMLSY
jgi:phage repressor protein C with HTH and peptisase S24 domain